MKLNIFKNIYINIKFLYIYNINIKFLIFNNGKIARQPTYWRGPAESALIAL